MATDVLLLFLLTQTAMALSPGPAVLLAMSQGAQRGLRTGVFAAAGIVTGTAAWVLLSAFGLTALLLASPIAFSVVKWVGAVYLVVLGMRMAFSTASGAGPTGPAVDARRVLLQGMVTQLANPKAMIFFGALLPQFVDLRRPVLPQLALLGAITVVNEFLVLVGYAWVADRGARLAGGRRALCWFDRIAGGLLVGAGAKLALLAP